VRPPRQRSRLWLAHADSLKVETSRGSHLSSLSARTEQVDFDDLSPRHHGTRLRSVRPPRQRSRLWLAHHSARRLALSRGNHLSSLSVRTEFGPPFPLPAIDELASNAIPLGEAARRALARRLAQSPTSGGNYLSHVICPFFHYIHVLQLDTIPMIYHLLYIMLWKGASVCSPSETTSSM